MFTGLIFPIHLRENLILVQKSYFRSVKIQNLSKVRGGGFSSRTPSYVTNIHTRLVFTEEYASALYYASYNQFSCFILMMFFESNLKIEHFTEKNWNLYCNFINFLMNFHSNFGAPSILASMQGDRKNATDLRKQELLLACNIFIFRTSWRVIRTY